MYYSEYPLIYMFLSISIFPLISNCRYEIYMSSYIRSMLCFSLVVLLERADVGVALVLCCCCRMRFRVVLCCCCRMFVCTVLCYCCCCCCRMQFRVVLCCCCRMFVCTVLCYCCCQMRIAVGCASVDFCPVMLMSDASGAISVGFVWPAAVSL
jgi:hypothetical protein